ncbi:MAG: GntR family transcriptional regulator, partial [Candidatus Obscuribacterales bacterium]|nr:GntR family transcriptional regulator [Candidatus Obscuribacterales bacterium]
MQITLILDELNGIPLYQQLVTGIIGLIDEGKLKRGEKLPSTRKLADDLGVSRATASKAYEELTRQGVIETSSTAGTFVSRLRPVKVMMAEPQLFSSGAVETCLPEYLPLSQYCKR